MKRSEINKVITEASLCFKQNGWSLPPNPKWDVTDFGLGNFDQSGLVLVNLAEEVEYCEKLMFAKKNQVTPSHSHKKKKEDIICRYGALLVQLWLEDPAIRLPQGTLTVKVNGELHTIQSGGQVKLMSGERVTIEAGVWHKFYPESHQCIIGEVSTANDDLHDNFFSDKNIGRFSEIVEDDGILVKLIGE